MKNKHIFWGIFFIAIGIFILINNVTSYNFFYEEVWKIWPFVLILLGISLMIKHELIRSVIVGMTALVLAFAVFSTFATAFDVFDNNFVHDYKDSEVTINDEYKINNYFESFRGKTSGATLNFDAGAGSFAITGTSDSLFEAKTEGANWNYNLVRSDRNNDTSIDFMMKKKRVTFRDGKFHNKVQMKLNPAPVWNINMNVGAAAIDLDLSKIKVNDLYIEMGAASLKTILGVPEKETRLRLEAGVSSIDIAVPGNVGCEIKTDISLSSKNFEGFKEVQDDIYRSPNFNAADKKIYLDLSTGVSSITVRRSGAW